MFWTWDFPLFRPLKSAIYSVKEPLLSNSQSKRCKSAKFLLKVGFQVQVKNFFEVDDVIAGDVIAKVFEKTTY